MPPTAAAARASAFAANRLPLARTSDVPFGPLNRQRLLPGCSRQCYAATPTTRQFAHLFVSWQIKVSHRRVDALINMPSVVRVDLCVQCLKLGEPVLVKFPAGHFLVLSEQRVYFF